MQPVAYRVWGTVEIAAWEAVLGSWWTGHSEEDFIGPEIAIRAALKEALRG